MQWKKRLARRFNHDKENYHVASKTPLSEFQITTLK